MRFVVLVAFSLFAVRRMLTFLHIFQQEEYDGVRFPIWILRQLAFDRRATAVLLVLGIAELIYPAIKIPAYIGACVALLAIAAYERDPRSLAKKRLVMTSRAKRIFILALVLTLCVGAGVSILSWKTLGWILPVQIIPFMLVLANFLLQPYEARNQKKFWNEAHDKLLSLKPTVIGITGSYGKTSVKHILSHLLGTYAPTLSTPGSVNTPMGISRVVREQLGPHHNFFLCEMGAYGIGSIARLCRLAPPDLAIITAIGHAHYERFKSLESVAKAKFELAEAVLQRNGKLIVTESVLESPFARDFWQRHQDHVVVVGHDSSCDCQVKEPRQSQDGIEVDVIWKDQTFALHSHLYGRHHALNLAVSFAAACVLGVPPEDAANAIRSVSQISHRLEVKHEANGQILIDDAYNSNPLGFINGLQILDLLRSGSGRRILVTPGMVELGTAHDKEHEKVGAEAGKRVDVLVAVAPQRISSLIHAYSLANANGAVIPCANFAEARNWMEKNLQPEDVVLLENDLPDLYESKLKL
jgi:UDP-N-acetylmuramoyl-tripeptide--D-alanyl-D-alanine ligase